MYFAGKNVLVAMSVANVVGLTFLGSIIFLPSLLTGYARARMILSLHPLEPKQNQAREAALNEVHHTCTIRLPPPPSRTRIPLPGHIILSLLFRESFNSISQHRARHVLVMFPEEMLFCRLRSLADLPQHPSNCFMNKIMPVFQKQL